MEKRRSVSRVMSDRFRPAASAAICPSSPSSGGESPTNPTSTLPSSSHRRRKPFPEIPHKVLRKQRSAEDLQIRRGGLWPSTKNYRGTQNTNLVAATLQDHLIHDNKNEDEEEEDEEEKDGRPIAGVAIHAASTFSSRQRASSDNTAFEINTGNTRRGRRYRSSLSSLASNRKKQPRTPPSPSSSSSSSSFSGRNIPSAARPPVDDENALARRRSEFSLDFPSTESDRNDARNSRSRAPIKIAGKVMRKSGSPVRRSKSPVRRNSRSPPVLHNSRSPVLQRPRSPPAKGMIGGGMGNIISMGLGSLFRRKSFSGAGVTAALTTKTTRLSSAKEAAINGLSVKRGMTEGVGSAARGAPPSAAELHHELRMAHSTLMQWRFVNGRSGAVIASKWATAQKALSSAWFALLELQGAVTQKQLQVANQRLSVKLNTLISPQIKAVERWGNIEKHHMAAISSTKDCLHAVVCRLPLTDRAKADPQILSILLRKATNLTAAINGNIATCHSMTQRTAPLVAELAQVVSKEKPLIEECFELLELVSKLQFREESLRCHLIQLKSGKYGTLESLLD